MELSSQDRVARTQMPLLARVSSAIERLDTVPSIECVITGPAGGRLSSRVL
jgi:hypothetical protein